MRIASGQLAMAVVVLVMGITTSAQQSADDVIERSLTALGGRAERGTSAQLAGKESLGGRDAYVVVFDPATGSQVRNYIDAETFLPIKTVMKTDVPQLGQEVEQTTEFFDFQDVDGVKIPFRLKTSSSIQSITITLTNVEHNVKVDESVFVKPGAF